MAQFDGQIFTILFVLFCVFYGYGSPVDDKNNFSPISGEKHDSFDWRFFKAICNSNKNVGKNVVVSPISVKLLLSILSEAAGPKARDQLSSNVLPLIQPGTATHLYYEQIISSLTATSEKYEFNTASKIYVDTYLTPTERFLQIALEYYKTSTETVKFSDKLKAAEVINDWCSKETKGNIKDLVNPGDMENVVAILVNAIYFKGTWEKLFPEDEVLTQLFKVNPTKSVETKIMMNFESFYYLDTDQLGPRIQMVRLPYKGGKYSMTLILPRDPYGLDEVIEAIKPGQIQILQKQLKERNLFIYIPKFKFDSTSHLKEIIQSLGISEIFNGTYPLPDLGKENIQVSNIIQKAGVIVDEKGTEIYAATELETAPRTAITPEFMADHPFLFFIEDETTGALLFAGKVVDPSVN